MGREKILYISQEIAPYLPDTPLSQFGRFLPQKMQEKGFEARTFMPKFGCINERRNQLHEVIRLSGINISIDDTDHPLIIKVATLQPSRMQVYFIDNEDFFRHSPVKDLELNTSPEDNDERMLFFVYGVLETVKKLRWEPAVVHITGWIASLIPLFMRTLYSGDPTFAKSKIIYTLRPESFEGALNSRILNNLKIANIGDEQMQSLCDAAEIDTAALNKIGMDYSDAVVLTHSELLSPELVKYAEETGKPVLVYDGDDNEGFDAFADFYNSLLGKEK